MLTSLHLRIPKQVAREFRRRGYNDPEEIESECWLRLWQAFLNFRLERSFARENPEAAPAALGGWLLRYCRSMAWRHVRHLRGRPWRQQSDVSAQGVGTPCREPPTGQRAEWADSLDAFYRKLLDDERAIVELLLEEELGVIEIADRLGLHRDTVRKRLIRMRRRLNLEED